MAASSAFRAGSMCPCEEVLISFSAAKVLFFDLQQTTQGLDGIAGPIGQFEDLRQVVEGICIIRLEPQRIGKITFRLLQSSRRAASVPARLSASRSFGYERR